VVLKFVDTCIGRIVYDLIGSKAICWNKSKYLKLTPEGEAIFFRKSKFRLVFGYK
jgi:hypothetical protein